jgi:hypothetical protein
MHMMGLLSEQDKLSQKKDLKYCEFCMNTDAECISMGIRMRSTHPCMFSLQDAADSGSENSTVAHPVDFPLNLSSTNLTPTCSDQQQHISWEYSTNMVLPLTWEQELGTG